MKKLMNFLIVVSFFCLSSVSYADKYGDFIGPLDSVINSGKRISYGEANLIRYKLAYSETINVLKGMAETIIAPTPSDCFGFNDVVDCTPIYCSRLKFLCDKENKILVTAIGQENIKPLYRALEECGLSENQFKYYLSDECF